MNNVVDMHAYRLRQRLIMEWKNPLLRASTAQLAAIKQDLAKRIVAHTSLELRLKWQLLMEVERG